MSEFAGMHCASAAEGNQRKLPRIMPALNRDHANRLFHVGVDHADHAGGKVFRRKIAVIFPEPLSNDLLRARQVELKVAAKKLVSRKTAKQKIGVSHGGAFALA